MVFKAICLGDIVGRPGREILRDKVQELKDNFQYDLLIANAENSAGGRGITPKVADELFELGVDFITLGDHTWDDKSILPYLHSEKYPIIGPANFSTTEAGPGFQIIVKNNLKIGILNLIGRVFINIQSDCPFKTADKIINDQLKACDLVILDFHAEATSEKYAMLRHLAGRVSLIVGTHTHVPTADAHIYKDTGYISDLGMTGCYEGVLGMDNEVALSRFLGIPKAYKIQKGTGKISGIYAEIDASSGNCVKIQEV